MMNGIAYLIIIILPHQIWHPIPNLEHPLMNPPFAGPNPPATLAGKVALITGASSGIGRAAAIELARRGASVVLGARRREAVQSVADRLNEAGFAAAAIQADVTAEQDIVSLIDKTTELYGRLDIAFNNAGTEGDFTPFLDQTNEIYDRIFNTNVRGLFQSMKHEARAMLAQGSGVIINNASMGGVIGFRNAGLYVASKHAVLGLTKTAALEWFPSGVRVNAICPGIIDTPLQDRIWPTDDAKRDFADSSVAGRAGTSEEMARIVAFLASDDASYISGHGLLADGGYSVA